MKRPRISLTPLETQDIEEIKSQNEYLKYLKVEEIAKIFIRSKISEFKGKELSNKKNFDDEESSGKRI